MSVRVKKVKLIDDVPTDQDCIILQHTELHDGLRVQIQWRRGQPNGRAVDRIAHSKCPANSKVALQLAKDLAFLAECKFIYVLENKLDVP